MPADALIYVLSEAEASAISELTLEPPPRALHRAFLVRVRLSPLTGG